MSRVFYFFLFNVIFFSCTNQNEEFYFGCTDPNASNFDSSAIEDDDSCLYYIGCTDPDACNYNFLAVEDDGSCQFAQEMVFQSENENDIYDIIDQKCVLCHNNIGLELNYSILTQNNGQTLIDFINGNAVGYAYNIMPPPGALQLTNCEKEEIKLWILNGMLE